MHVCDSELAWERTRVHDAHHRGTGMLCLRVYVCVWVVCEWVCADVYGCVCVCVCVCVWVQGLGEAQPFAWCCLVPLVALLRSVLASLVLAPFSALGVSVQPVF